jgi:2-polyprenyl-3-methyl-5-hydroxy-6-metoxy-1,4-benzoquinol methylase
MRALYAGSDSSKLTVRAWQNQDIRTRIEQYVLGKNFKNAPALGFAFLSEMNRLINTSHPEEEIFTQLRVFFEQTEGLQTAFFTERETRVERRGGQITELLNGRRVSSLLDVGCGGGEITNELMQTLKIPPERVKGLEVVLDESSRGMFPFDIIQFDGCNFPSFGQTFELVTLLSVLHHAREPIRLIREVSGALAVGGYLIVRECDA